MEDGPFVFKLIAHASQIPKINAYQTVGKFFV